MNAIEAQLIDPQAFAAMPAMTADPQALQRSGAPHRIFTVDGAEAGEFEAKVPAITRIPIAQPALARRFFTGDYERACIVVAHRFGPAGELEIVASNYRLPISRGIIRNVAHWIFVTLGARRVVARIRAGDRQTQDLARRVGFKFEGRAEKYFADDEDAVMWAMTAASCRWLW